MNKGGYCSHSSYVIHSILIWNAKIHKIFHLAKFLKLNKFKRDYKFIFLICLRALELLIVGKVLKLVEITKFKVLIKLKREK